MIVDILGAIFPPELGKVDIDSILRLKALQEGTLETYRANDPEYAGVVAVFEWPEGRNYKPKRIR